jgi:hypothetical protein
VPRTYCKVSLKKKIIDINFIFYLTKFKGTVPAEIITFTSKVVPSAPKAS